MEGEALLTGMIRCGYSNPAPRVVGQEDPDGDGVEEVVEGPTGGAEPGLVVGDEGGGLDAGGELDGGVEEEGGAEELEDEPGDVPQEISYAGLSERLLPIIPKLGLGVVGAASWRTYHLRNSSATGYR